MPDGSYSPTGTFDALLGGAPQAASPTAAPGVVPPPANPPAPAPAAPAAPAVPFSPTATFDSILANPAAAPPASADNAPAAPPGAVGNIFRRERASPDASNPEGVSEFMGAMGAGAAQLPISAANTLNAGINAPIRGINALFGTQIPQLNSNIQNPLQQAAPTESDRIIQGAGQAVGSMLPMVMGGAAMETGAAPGSVAQGVGQRMASVPARALPAVAAGGAAGQAASDNVPAPYKGLASVAGNMLGGAGESLVQEGAAAGANTLSRVASEAGVGGRESVNVPGAPPIKATAGQVSKVAGKIQQAGGQQLLQDLAKDPMQDAHDAIGAKLNGSVPLENGETMEDLKGQQGDIKAAMAARGSQYERAPGTQPTTVQVSPQNKLGGLDKQAKLNPSEDYGAPAFQSQRQAQNAAFVANIEKNNPGITSKLGDAFVEKATDLEDAKNSTQAAGQQAMQQATAPLSINNEPAQTGGNLRQAFEDAQTARKQQGQEDIWSQVPKDMQHSVVPAAELARTLTGNAPINIPNDASPELLAHAQQVNEHIIDPRVETPPSEETAVLQKVATLPATLPYRATAKLLSTISTAKAQLAKGGYSGTPSMVRLRMIEGSLQDSMAGDFSKRLSAGEIPLMPEPSPEGQEALNAGRADWADISRTYSRGPVGQVLAKGARDYKIQDLATVAKTILSGNDSEPENVAKALDALKNNPDGVQALREGLISDANRRGVIKPDGSIDTTKYPRFMTPARASTLKQFPGLHEQFENAAAMQTHVDLANANATAAVKANSNSVAKSFLGEDPQLAVRRAVNAGDGGRALGQIYQAVQHDPGAVSALQGHVTNEILNKFASEARAPAGQDAGMVQAQKFRQFIKDNRTPLRQILGGQGMQRLDQVRASLKDAQGAEAAIPGSQTAPLRIIASGAGVGHKPTGISAMIGGEIGEHLMEGFGHGGLMQMAGAGGLGLITHLGMKFRAAGIHTQNDLNSAMMQHPELLKAMIQKYPVRPGAGATMAKNLGSALNAVTMATLSGQAKQ